MNILITGGAGFIGSHLYKKLKEQGHTIKGYDLYWQQDINYELGIADAIRKADIVYHLAAKIDVRESNEKPELYYKTNVGGTMNVVSACLRYQKKLIYTSSAAIYNPSSSVYANSKYIADLIVQAAMPYIPVVCLRLFNVYGKGMSKECVMYRFLHENPTTVYGDGKQTRDFIAIEDVVSVLDAARSDEWNGKTMDVGTGIPVSIKVLAEWFHKPIVYQQKRKEVRNSVADTTMLQTLYDKPLQPLPDTPSLLTI